MIYLAGLILGLSSTLHCLGMCGPLALAIPLNRTSKLSIFLGSLQYNSGRLVSYAILGVLVAMIGMTIKIVGLLQWISLLSGVLIIIYALKKLILVKIQTKTFLSTRLFSSLFSKILSSQSHFKIFFLGILNGLLPCGMVYLALLNSMLGSNFFTSSIAMVCFGLGTFPAMIFVSFAANRISVDIRKKLNKLTPYFLILVGSLIIIRGLNLGIPYLSPEIQTVQTKMIDTKANSKKSVTEVEMTCCHAKTKRKQK